MNPRPSPTVVSDGNRESCRRKKARGNVYRSLREAADAASRMKYGTGDPVRAYKCPCGGHFHVGKFRDAAWKLHGLPGPGPADCLLAARGLAARLLRDRDREELIPRQSELEAVAYSLAERFLALDGWLSSGGNSPREWQHGENEENEENEEEGEER